MTVSDKGSPELTALLEGFEVDISVGIHAEEGSATHGEDGLTNAEIGSIHEFGLGVPQESFVRGYFDDNQAAIDQLQVDALNRVLGGADPEAEAARLGATMEGGMKERILARIPPPLAESTKRKRGETAVPLVDTSQLIGSIRSKVTRR